ncbi:hypothetical protein C5167_035921 [Papaver somniferum]|uniref:uncharacterized protein LOC113331150 isoform X1 n=1 Tax=Papaver somniferum TaxID=3469 RepID=UPI000E6F6F11|nr:uncharacterized protein LOC113331150 isoform X1 [Papaver somniferum]RZC87380.1 hypothetical protein C5167_035921 [Papaver somniferum]
MNNKNNVSSKKVSSKNSQGKSIAKVVYTPLKDLRFKQTQNKTIKVKVPKVWISQSNKTGEVWGLEAHVIDEEGTQIQLKVNVDNIDLFRGKFLDGCVYSIQRFTFQVPTGGYRIVPFHYFMWLNKYAKIQQLEVDASTFPIERFTFLPLEMVPGRKNENHFYTNVIGRLHSISNVVGKQVEERGETKEVNMREIYIADERGKTMKITIWGELATTIEDGMLDSNQNVAVVIIITGTFVKERMGFISLSTTQASRIFVNLDSEQVQEFRMLLGKETEEIEEIHLEQEKDPFEDKITLYEASQMLLDYENKNKEFFCEASIVRFNEGKGWYYIACKKCKKQVQNNDGKISCPKCIKTFDGKVLTWYRITVRIKDNTEYADFTIFGFNVEKMLKYTAAEHVDYAERCEKLGEPDKAKQVFDKLIGEKFGFKLKITEENIQKQSDDYTVLKVHTIVKKKRPPVTNWVRKHHKKKNNRRSCF